MLGLLRDFTTVHFQNVFLNILQIPMNVILQGYAVNNVLILKGHLSVNVRKAIPWSKENNVLLIEVRINDHLLVIGKICKNHLHFMGENL